MRTLEGDWIVRALASSAGQPTEELKAQWALARREVTQPAEAGPGGAERECCS